MTLSPYALDDVCVWLLADDAYSDGGKIYCTRMYIGLTVSGVEQDIIEAPQTLAATDGTFEFDPANPQEQAGYTSMPQTYYGINGFSADSCRRLRVLHHRQARRAGRILSQPAGSHR